MIPVHYTNAVPFLPLLIEWQFSTLYLAEFTMGSSSTDSEPEQNRQLLPRQLQAIRFFLKSRRLIERSRVFYAKNF